MQHDLSTATLFEVSWEVCNKVGGIYTVVSSKALRALDVFGENYYLLGPDFGNNAGFEETDEPCWETLRADLARENLLCRLGRWDIPGRPKTILVNFKERYNSAQLLYSLWNRYGVDSLSGGWDYIEPVLFSTACSEVIAAACKQLSEPAKGPVLAHFHEWMCGAGLLDIKNRNPGVATIFTTHATVLGRSMAASGFDIYKHMHQINPRNEAGAYNVTAKCSLESASANEADCFTTVSGVTGEEASVVLGRAPDIITHNGVDLRTIPDYTANRAEPCAIRGRVLEAAGRLLRCDLPDDTRICLVSGRYEFHNKGIDVFMDALAGVNQDLAGSQRYILALCVVMGGHNGLDPDAVSGGTDKSPEEAGQGSYWISSHHVHNPANDPILKICKRTGLDNRPENRVKFVFVPALLDGHDGFFNLEYYSLLSACDLGVFPSWYEPWGYTPQESAAFAVPTVTTDLSGFGHWVRDMECDDCDKSGVLILPRRQTTYDATVASLRKAISASTAFDEESQGKRRLSARGIARQCTWEKFFSSYVQAYAHALDKARERRAAPDSSNSFMKLVAANTNASPALHSFNAITGLPLPIGRLRELARNLWWCWHPVGWELFSQINPEVWEESGHNPVETIEKTSPQEFARLASDRAFLRLYSFVTKTYDDYMGEAPQEDEYLRKEAPVAYFSMEYGINECLPVYSGGLGVLSGDHLKSASDLNIPFVGVGLLYKSGYFHQTIDKEGRQTVLYPDNNFENLPLERITDAEGHGLDIELDLPGRKLYAQVWKIRVGRVDLYLLDTDSPKNTTDDRRITARLYEADRDFRLKQEILLGIGGIRLLRTLGIQPSVYHMNEGHSAFLILERIRLLMLEKGLSFDEAGEYVRGNNVFTTHTPVEAGNEHFTIDRMEPYFTHYTQSLGLSWNDFLRAGRLFGSERNVYEMTVLALNYSYKANGVSAMHGLVSRHMWQKHWPGVPAQEIPISHVTNGVHVPSWIGAPMYFLLVRYLGENCLNLPPGSPTWEKIMEIPESQIWSTKQLQKTLLYDRVRMDMPDFFRRFDIPSDRQKAMLANLDPNALVIGFARRFAPYKRAELLFADPDRLAKMLNDPARPMLFIFSGKAHPADVHGADILQKILRYSLEPRFFGKIFFIEDYSLEISRLMVQGCNVWLNTPRRPHEASGTSGQKISANGGLNLSVSDGWWCEGFDGSNGWTIGPVLDGTVLPDCGQDDYDDAEALYALLEETILPLYFDTGPSTGLPRTWAEKAKHAMFTLTAKFHSNRMVNEYYQDYYLPAAKRGKELDADDMALAKRIAAWKHDVAGRFCSMKIEQIAIDGLEKDTLQDTRPMQVCVTVAPGDMRADELLVQLVVGPGSGGAFDRAPDIVPMKLRPGGRRLKYEAEYTAQKSGRHVFGVRIIPVCEGLGSLWETQLVLWG